MQPRTRARGGISYDRYALNRQIHCADTYPFSAPNGSKIVVCGHESGVLILWKGASSSEERRNDDQQASSESDTDMNEEEEFERIEQDSVKQPPKSVQTLDLMLGTAVLHLSFPPLPQLPRPQEVPQAPSLLQHNLVVALACADNTIRLLTIPLKAPSIPTTDNKKSQQDLLSVGKGAWGERMVTISNAHQKVPQGIALAFISRDTTKDNDHDEDGSMDALIASYAADLTGSLLVHRIPITPGKEVFGTPELWRLSPLVSPPCSMDMFVSPVSGASPKILVGESKGVVRVFECRSAKHQTGMWTLSLFAPEVKASEHYSTSILCATWILEGHAIAVLTGEGEWGIWNVSYGGSGRGISASRPNPFTFTGRVGVSTRNVSRKSTVETAENKPQLAPMTPGARKMRQESLFTGKGDSAGTRGGISVKRTIGSYSTGEIEESLLFWHGENVVYLPSVQAYWQNKIKGASGTSGVSASGNLRDTMVVNFGEDARIGVSAFPSESLSTNHPDYLVVGERSFVVAASQPESRISSEFPAINQSRNSDQSLLSGGLLDVNGLGRILDGMRSNRSSAVSGSLTQKRVLFE